MPRPAFIAAATLALLSAAQLQATQTAKAARVAPCMTRPEVEGMVAYVLPAVLDSTIAKCRPELPASAYLIARAPRLSSDLAAGRESAWPMARQAFGKFGGGGKDSRMMAQMPDELLRPLISFALESELSPSIKPENCKDIDRVAAVLEPLPAANVVSLITELMVLGGRNDGKLNVCASA